MSMVFGITFIMSLMLLAIGFLILNGAAKKDESVWAEGILSNEYYVIAIILMGVVIGLIPMVNVVCGISFVIAICFAIEDNA